LFRWKGLLIESLRRQSQLNALKNDPQLGAQVKELISLRSKYTELYHLAGKMSFDEWKRASAEMLATKESLERKLNENAHAGRVQDILTGVSEAQFCGLLKEDECLADVYYYKALDKRQDASVREYAAFILDKSGNVRALRLGAAATLNEQIKEWLQHAQANQDETKEFAEISSRLAPIVTTAATKKLFVCPDADLNLLPLSNFLNCPLVAQLDSPRELAYLRIGLHRDGSSAAGAAVTNSAAGAAVTSSAAGAAATGPSSEIAQNFFCIGGVDFGKRTGAIMIPPLPGTLREVQSVAAQARARGFKVVELHGLDANKERVVAELPKAEMAHLATHGFFSEQSFAEQVFALESSNASKIEENQADARDPLAKSGLLLAREAGNQNQEEQFQILSAEELVGCDLHRCKSLVLSACETGLGDKENGQGVLGLRASLMAAGARMLLISLWRVPDSATAVFMNEFYRNLWQNKQCPAEALKKAQAVVAARSEVRRPNNWAAWVLIGDGW
jgi:CHAT domain-containing protein